LPFLFVFYYLTDFLTSVIFLTAPPLTGFAANFLFLSASSSS